MDQRKRQRYANRRLARERVSTNSLRVVPDRARVEVYRNHPLDSGLVDEILTNLDSRYHVPTQEFGSSAAVDELLAEMKRGLDQEHIDLLLGACRDSVLDSIILPFGLNRAMFDDKTGGNVTTVHNFKQGITATREDAEKFQGYDAKFDRCEYETLDLVRHRKKRLQAEGPLMDAYTSVELPKDERAQLDHVVSAKEIHQDARAHLFLSGGERVQMANSDTNLVMTHHSVNQSKAANALDEWMDKPSKDGITPAERHGVDREKARGIDKASRKQINEKLLHAQVKKQGTELLNTGASQGIRLGLQQSIGLLFREFVVGLFDEARDIFQHGFTSGRMDSGFWAVLKERTMRVVRRVIDQWKEVLVSFRDGAISGFLSNLVTFLINSLMTTVARVARVIREGFFSLFRAFKIVLFPPEHLTRKQAAHEATKLLGAALVTTGGILLEELVEKFMQSVPVIGQIANLVTPVIMGLITGITSSIVVYLIDKLDLLGVMAEVRQTHVLARLDQMIDGLVQQAEASYAVFKLPVV